LIQLVTLDYRIVLGLALARVPAVLVAAHRNEMPTTRHVFSTEAWKFMPALNPIG
jgi:hypothetical protein